MFAVADCGYNAEVAIGDWRATSRLFWVTNNPFGWDWKPTWSPDGQQIAYELDTDNQRAIYIVDLATGSRRLLTPSVENALLPAWSPDGKSIAFPQSVGTNTSPIYIADLLSGNIRELEVTAAPFMPPAWSPDSQFLAFTDYSTDNGEIFILDVATGETRNISNSATADDLDPAWSSDGKNIAFTSSSTRDSFPRLYIAEVETGAVHNLSNDTTRRYAGFAWSPDGDYIAVIVNEREVRIMDMAGNVIQSIVPPQIPDIIHGISWSPNGAYLAVVSDPPGEYFVHLTSGTRYTVLPLPAGCDGSPVVWLPQ